MNPRGSGAAWWNGPHMNRETGHRQPHSSPVSPPSFVISFGLSFVINKMISNAHFISKILPIFVLSNILWNFQAQRKRWKGLWWTPIHPPSRLHNEHSTAPVLSHLYLPTSLIFLYAFLNKLQITVYFAPKHFIINPLVFSRWESYSPERSVDLPKGAQLASILALLPAHPSALYFRSAHSQMDSASPGSSAEKHWSRYYWHPSNTSWNH